MSDNKISVKDLLQKDSGVFKVVLFGPESTGKSTLCRQLAGYFQTVCNPEYMREYLEKKWQSGPQTVDPEDMLPIAKGQIQKENELSRQARRILISDTDLLELAVYSEVYFGQADPILLEAALKNKYDLYFLTYIDVPWTPDPMRDKPGERPEMFDRFKQTLEKYRLPYVILKGNAQERLNIAVSIIKTLMENNIRFTKDDLAELQRRNIPLEAIIRQVGAIKNGNLYRNIIRPAIPGDGILQLDEKQKEEAVKAFYEIKNKIVRFVPASGAATRMFKDFHMALQAYREGITQWKRMVDEDRLDKLKDFGSWKQKLAFYDPVVQKIKQDHKSYSEWDEDKKNFEFINYTLTEKGLNYGLFPKALILFHRYDNNEIRTAFEEHLNEAVKSGRAAGHLHFTVHPEKKGLFEAIAGTIQDKYQVQIDYSFQSPSTDTIMLDTNRQIVRDENGKMVFRPGGHGALLHNLQNIDADYIFIKNIDNVQKDAYKGASVLYFQILTGLLHQIKTRRDTLLGFLQREKPGKKELAEVEQFLTDTLGLKIIAGYENLPASQRRTYLTYKLNRPLRIAGMVKNTGQAGGGPFWVKDDDGNESLQIVEKSEIDLSRPGPKQVFETSTHFNPVFMVASIKDFEGKPYNLPDFRDDEAAFISRKVQYGKEVFIYEHPGLWNGGMAGWITLFVEVPDEVFSPVKEVYDLTFPPHL